jgi:hypothetical protein
MASTSSSDRTKLSTTMSIFNGLNYHEWADAIKSFMQYNLVWFLIEGYGSTATTKQPSMPRPTQAANQVNNAGIKVKKQLVALLLVNCLPKSYQQIASMILTTHVDLTKLKPSNVCPKIIEEESRRMANRMQISHISKAPQLKKYCEKCGKNTNHTTEQHWKKGKRPNSNNNNR